MDLRSLRHFVLIAETLSFSRAAEVLQRSQPGLSRSIKELEAEFGLELFERVGRKVSLRPEGEALLGDARSLLADADRLLEQAQLLSRGRTLILRVGGAAHVLGRIMPEVMRRYRKSWGNVEVQLRAEGGADLLAAIERGELDVGITRTTNSDLLKSGGAFAVDVVAALNRRHRLAERIAIAVTDLKGESLLLPPPNFSTRILLDAAFSAEHIRPYLTLESQNLHTLVTLAEAGQGAALVPSIVATDGLDVAIVPIRYAGRPLSSSTSLVWARRRSLPPHVSAFIEVAGRYVKQGLSRARAGTRAKRKT
jgi:DNA-binding transcriptional LysR family regulator